MTTRLGFWDVLFNVESSGAGGDVVVESGRGVVDVGSRKDMYKMVQKVYKKGHFYYSEPTSSDDLITP